VTTALPPSITPATERMQAAVHSLLTTMGYAPRKTWAVGGFIFVAMPSEEKAKDLLHTLSFVSWVQESELKHEADGSPYIIARYQQGGCNEVHSRNEEA